MANILETTLNTFEEIKRFLLSTKRKPTIIIKQTEHLSETLYATPVIRHYRNKYPTAIIAFVTGNKYAEVHKNNPHIDRLFTIPNKPEWRLDYKKKMESLSDIDYKIAPSIDFIQWPNHTHQYLYNQYLANAGIAELKPLGGRIPICVIGKVEQKWAEEFIKNNHIVPEKTIALEYNCYSHACGWTPKEFQRFVYLCHNLKIQTVAFASKKEATFTGSIDARGTSWLRTAALLNRLRGVVGVSSGISVLATSCQSKPFIFEVNTPVSISIMKMGLSERCISMNHDPEHLSRLVWDKLKST